MSGTRQAVINIAIDLGGSSTKFIIGKGNKEGIAVVMSPSITEIATKPWVIEGLCGDPEDNAAIEIEGCWYAVGSLADAEGAVSKLHIQKANLAAQKILAATWVATKKLEIKQKKIKVNILCTLPCGEMGDISKLESDTRRLLASFESPDGKLEVKLEDFKCYPEGIGIGQEFRIISGKAVEDMPYLVLMMGHRNISSFVGKNGGFSSFGSSSAGFSTLVDKIVEKTALGYTSEGLLPVIVEYLKSKDSSKLSSHLKEVGGRESDALVLKSVTDSIEKIYWNNVVTWINYRITKSPKFSVVVIGGGASEIFRDDAIKHFAGILPRVIQGKAGIYFHAGENSIVGVDVPKGYEKRFHDIYFAWKNLMA
jgi:Actin like proteins N terminal domain